MSRQVSLYQVSDNLLIYMIYESVVRSAAGLGPRGEKQSLIYPRPYSLLSGVKNWHRRGASNITLFLQNAPSYYLRSAIILHLHISTVLSLPSTERVMLFYWLELDTRDTLIPKNREYQNNYNKMSREISIIWY